MTTLGSYELLGQVAARGSGRVWKARDVGLGRQVALKQVPTADPALVAGLRAEAATLAGLDDEHVVAVFGFFEEGGHAYLVEEWIEGATVARVIAGGARLSTPQALGVVRGALLGLAHSHERGVVHGDVSTSNVIVDLGGTSRLIDFGRSGTGTPAYRSPERASGAPATREDDVHAAAAVLVHLLTGATGAAGLSRVDAGLQPVLRRALAPRPAERYPDARTFLDALSEDAERSYGPGWWTQAGLGALVAPAVAVLTGLGGGAVAGGAPIVGSAGGAVGGAVVQAASGASRGSRLPLLVGAGGLAVVAATVAAFVAFGSEPDDERASDPVAAAPSTAADVEPVLSEEEQRAQERARKIEELVDSAPTGRWRLRTADATDRLRNGSTVPAKDPPRIWTLDDPSCTTGGCTGTLASSSGSTFEYRWTGSALVIERPPASSPKAACVDTVTREPLPISESAASQSYTYSPIRLTGGGEASGPPRRLDGGGTYRVKTRFFGTCTPSPEDVVGGSASLTLTSLDD